MAKRSHLELHADQAHLFYGAGPADVAVANERHRLAIELREHVVHGVLERRRVAVVVLAGDDDEAVGAVDCPAEAGHVLTGVITLCPGRGDGVIVERQRMVPEVQDLEVEVVAPREAIHQPRNRLVREAARPRAADDELDEWHRAKPTEGVASGSFPTSLPPSDLMRSGP